jgi:hypothetical protein
MMIQVKNTTKANFNIIRSNSKTLVQDVKNQGWILRDCVLTELKDELVTNVYRGVDGKTGNKYKK